MIGAPSYILWKWLVSSPSETRFHTVFLLASHIRRCNLVRAEAHQMIVVLVFCCFFSSIQFGAHSRSTLIRKPACQSPRAPFSRRGHRSLSLRSCPYYTSPLTVRLSFFFLLLDDVSNLNARLLHRERALKERCRRSRAAQIACHNNFGPPTSTAAATTPFAFCLSRSEARTGWHSSPTPSPHKCLLVFLSSQLPTHLLLSQRLLLTTVLGMNIWKHSMYNHTVRYL